MTVVELQEVVDLHPDLAPPIKGVLADRFHSLLSHFRLPRTSSFRDLLRETRTIIAGYPVLQYAIGMEPSRAALDLYVASEHCAEIRTYLRKECGYVGDPSSVPKYVTSANEKIGIEATTRLIHYDFSTATSRKINLMTVTTGLHHARAVAFGGTTAFAYLTADAIHVFSPRMTCQKQALVLMHDSFGTPWNSLGFENPYHLVGPTGNLIRKMVRDGFDVRYPRLGAGGGSPCGFACPAKAAAEGNDLTQTWVFGDGDGIVDEMGESMDAVMAYYTQFLVSGVCYNPACPNYV